MTDHLAAGSAVDPAHGEACADDDGFVAAVVDALQQRGVLGETTIMPIAAGAHPLSRLHRLSSQAPDGEQILAVLRSVQTGGFGLEYPEDCLRHLYGCFRRSEHLGLGARNLQAGAWSPSAGALLFFRDASFFCLEEYVEGRSYGPLFAQLQRSSHDSERALHADVAVSLAREIAKLHQHERRCDGRLHRRALRDLVSGGEGVAGLVDGYGVIDAQTLTACDQLERECLFAVQRLRLQPRLLCRTHGDLHPWNIILNDGQVRAIDPGRTEWCDPAADVGSMLMNYVAVGLWEGDLARSFGLDLARTFLRAYIEAVNDEPILQTLPAFTAMRAAAVVSPTFYPDVPHEMRLRTLRGAVKVCRLACFDLDLNALPACFDVIQGGEL